ncbi:Fip1-domain-containing protein [Pluteus cervinus]|uniref:Fip1-domain-containing protein n=1 Tax=Pluteus cervinus TaxID=181527 RepID=A0ACD3AXH7_9AGAR|nr:Fip1-domain-containing protein [Pluteus cervinus]
MGLGPEPEEDAVGEEEGEERQERVEESEEDDDDDDVEIIMEPINRSLDFRAPRRPAPSNAPRSSHPQPSLTTEYTPIQRGGPPPSNNAQPSHHPPSSTTPSIPTQQQQQQQQPQQPQQQPSQQQPQFQQHPQQTQQHQSGSLPPLPQDELGGGGGSGGGPDPSTLPPVSAPPSHPAINPEATGMLDGRTIFDVDLAAMSDKPWRRPGSDISDWFNYGFDEISWEAYIYRRRELGDMANVLKANVMNFSGVPEEQLVNMPNEVRQMVMTGTTAMMNNAGANAAAAAAAMMNPGVMMDMSMMNPMAMGMNGDMGMGGGMMQMGVDGTQGQQGVVGVVGGNATPEQVGVGGGMGVMQDAFGGGPGGGNMMGMGMGGDYAAMQEQQNVMGQQMYQNMEVPQNVAPGPSGSRSVGVGGGGPGGQGGGPTGPSGAPVPYRGRGIPGGMGMRGGRGFSGRGRGRGGFHPDSGPPPVPVRPASPLPPGVPTGPRNQNKYKDRDNNGPAVDGLDYGGTNKDLGGRTSSGEPEERSSSRKRRNSPGLEDGRGSKRR